MRELGCEVRLGLRSGNVEVCGVSWLMIARDTMAVATMGMAIAVRLAIALAIYLMRRA